MEKETDPIEENNLDNVANSQQPNNSQPPDNLQPPDNSQPPTGNSQPPTGNSQPPTGNSQATEKKKKILSLKHGVTMKESILVIF